MCSRYCLTSPPEAVRAFFCHDNEAVYPPRYNIAPTQPVAIVRMSAKKTRELVLVRWGLIPPWVKDPNEFATLINARAETAAEKPSFRSALRYRRCLVPADGFYEWTGRKGNKQPHLLRRKLQEADATVGPGDGGSLLAFAGLWEHWLGAEGSEMETMVILTTKANKTLAPLHDRMPVILEQADHARWLDCAMGKTETITDLLRPADNDLLEIVAVNPQLNNPRHEGPELQQPLPLL